MKRFKNPLWLLLVIGLVVVGGLATVVMALRGEETSPLQLDDVTVQRATSGPATLTVTGRGLHNGLQAMLLPDLPGGGAGLPQPELPFTFHQFVTDGRVAVANARGNRLLALDVAAGHRPTVFGEITLSDPVSQPELPVSALAMIGSRVLIGRGKHGLTLADVSDLEAPRQLDHLAVPRALLDMKTVGDTVYVASQEAGLQVVTIGGDRLRSRQVPGSLAFWRIAVQGRRLVAATSKGEVALFELDPQGWPQPAGRLSLSRELRDLAFSGKALYAATTDGKLLEFSLARWPQPALAGTLDLNGRPLRLAVDAAASRLFCSLISSGLAVIDIGRPGAPALIQRIAMARAPTSLQIQGGRLFAAGAEGLHILPIEQLANSPAPPPTVYPFAYDEGSPSLFALHGAVYASSNQELVSLDGPAPQAAPAGGEDAQPDFLALPGFSDVRLYPLSGGRPESMVPERIPVGSPEVVRVSSNVRAVRDAFWQDGALYALTPTRLKVFRRGAGGELRLEHDYALPQRATAMEWLAPGWIVVAIRQLGLQVLDVRDQRAPRLVGEYPIPRYLQSIGMITDLLLDGRRLFVARAMLGVEIYDLTEPAAPRLFQRIDTPGYAENLTLENDLLIVGSVSNVFAIDVSGRYGVPVGGYQLPAKTNGLLVHGSRLFTVTSSGGVVILAGPQRLEARSALPGEMVLAVPDGVPAGRYALVLYADGAQASLPVVID